MSDHSPIPTDRRALLAGIGGLAAGTFLTAGGAQAGPLDPAEAPASTPGPEPRIAINAQNTPGSANSVFRITQPGSYYLEADVLGESGKNGITIAASTVTIDLNGFALIGVSGSLFGIATQGTRGQMHVRNGTVRQWGSGGINLFEGGFGRDSRIEDVAAIQNSGIGIGGADYPVIRRCLSSGNGGSGIQTRFRALITECHVSNNSSVGILFGSGSLVVGCFAVQGNGVGIQGGPNGTMVGCKSASNGSHGYNVGGSCIVRDCAAIGNSGTGIRFVESANTAEGNVCTGNTRGVEAIGGDNLIIRNKCSGNTTANWEIAAGNNCLVVSATSGGAISGDSGGTSIGSTDPNANYTF